MHFLTAISLVLTLTVYVTAGSLPYPADGVSLSLDPTVYPATDIIEKDVVIVGGGSSGAYTAVRLRDSNKSVIVIEKKDTLGGHAETYVDPFTGYTTDIGVVVFHPVQIVKNYFARFNVSLVAIPSVTPGQSYVDFNTGHAVDFEPPALEKFQSALRSYLTQLNKYPELQSGFDLSYPVNPDLLLSFRAFVEKYNLQDIVAQTFSINQGYSPILDLSMLYIFKYLNTDEVQTFFGGTTLTTTRHDVQELYQKIKAFLGSDAFTSTNVLAVSRPPYSENSKSGVRPIRVLVQTPTGRKLILAKELVITIPPLLSNLAGFDLNENEQNHFGKFYANGYYTGILNNTGLNESLAAAGPSDNYGVPHLPGPYAMTLNAEGLTQVYYGSPSILPDETVKDDIVSRLKRVQRARGLSTATDPDWLIFSSHSPFNLMVSNEEISNGFYRDLTDLQGKRNTYWHGAAWHTQDSTELWKFTDNYLLPKILSSL
ncbi:amine oxidase, flavin-containing superfamily [Nemania sp. FL0916]|nr:amine oxidase, flavin-containing superfamily [Nemania sp. FL0916]